MRWPDLTLEERFMQYVEPVTESGCWIWLGSMWGSYGSFQMGKGRSLPAHKAAWEIFRGAFPKGLQADHLCLVKICVNPWHIEPVTVLENLRRGGNIEAANEARRTVTHCKHGHEFTPENTYHDPSEPHRKCRTCILERSRRYHAQERARKRDTS